MPVGLAPNGTGMGVSGVGMACLLRKGMLEAGQRILEYICFVLGLSPREFKAINVLKHRVTDLY